MGTRRDSASDVAKRLKADPLKYIIEKFNRLGDDEPQKVSLALELLPYCYPKLKAVDVKTDQPLNVVVTFGTAPSQLE